MTHMLSRFVLFLNVLIMTQIFAHHHAYAAPFNTDDSSAIMIDLSQNQIDIDSAFSGTSVTLFGIQKAAGDIILVVRGPAQNKVIREKSNFMGLWLTTKSVRFQDTPGYYAVASNANVSTVADRNILKKQQIGLDYLRVQPLRQDQYKNEAIHLKRYQDAFIQTQQINGLYVLRTAPITYVTEGLFKIALWFPSNIPVGDYTINAYLFDKGEIKSEHHKTLTIARAGFNASLKEFSMQSPWTYALMTIMIAMISGWLATVLLRKD